MILSNWLSSFHNALTYKVQQFAYIGTERRVNEMHNEHKRGTETCICDWFGFLFSLHNETVLMKFAF
jgi:hypothetical protein